MNTCGYTGHGPYPTLWALFVRRLACWSWGHDAVWANPEASGVGPNWRCLRCGAGRRVAQ